MFGANVGENISFHEALLASCAFQDNWTKASERVTTVTLWVSFLIHSYRSCRRATGAVRVPEGTAGPSESSQNVLSSKLRAKYRGVSTFMGGLSDIWTHCSVRAVHRKVTAAWPRLCMLPTQCLCVFHQNLTIKIDVYCHVISDDTR
jgi:hypothetical protein